VIVLDASAAVEIVLTTPRGRVLEERIEDPEVLLAAPSILDVEVLHALRRLVRSEQVEEERALLALALIDALGLDRYPPAPFKGRIWELRHALTAYDATYCALAEALGATLLTCDARLAGTPDPPCRIELVD